MADAAMRWIVGNDTGISSKAIWAHMNGLPVGGDWGADGSFPRDPGDFGRCYRLLALNLAWRLRIGEMAAYGDQWKALAEAWDELESLYEAEIDRSVPRHRGAAPRLYARMQALLSPTPPEAG